MPRGRPRTLIGPRRANGRFYLKPPKPAPKTVKGTKLTKPLKNAIERILNKNIETKYVISSLINLSVTNTCRSKMTPAGVVTFNYLRQCIPSLQQASAMASSNDLIGAKAKIVSLRTIFHFNLDTSNAAANDVMVKVFLIQSRNVKNLTVANAGLPAGNLLRTGNADEDDWVPASGFDARYTNMLPLNKLAWTGKTRTFRLTKNSGIMNSGTSTTVPLLANGNASYDFTHDWKAGGKVIRYDEGDGSSYPENYLPLVGMVAWYPDGTQVGSQDSIMPVNVTVSNHLYYKDA